MACIFCAIVAKKILPKYIYEDEHMVAVLPDEPATPGHLMIIPKKHIPIFEEMDENLTDHLFSVANKMSIALFESVGAQGTNILVQNGIPAGQEVAHFCINVLPRKENDGLNLEWQTKQISDDEMSTAELAIKDGLTKITTADKKTESPTTEKEAQTPQAQSGEKSEENYLVRQLKRIP